MKTSHLSILSILAAFALVSAPAHAEKIPNEKLIEAFKQNPYRAAAGHNAYEAPAEVIDTPAPKGYKPFYVSHFGRHGSRFQGSESAYSGVCQTLDKLHEAGLLTACGDTLRAELQQMWDAHKNQMEGMLTLKGGQEHKGIAQRLCERVPAVFKQKSRAKISCTSTVVPRCIESMGYFAMEVQSFNPSLDITMDVGFKIQDFQKEIALAPDPKEIRKHSGPAEQAMLQEAGTMPTLAARLLTSPEEARRLVPDEDLGKFLFNMFKAAAGAGCLDQKFDPLRFFTPEELLVCNKIRNIHFCSSYGCFGPTRDIAVRHSYPYALLIIKEAEEAIAGNERCADLRFAHDKQVGPTLSLLDLENYNVYTPIDQSHNYLAAWKYLSMGTNLQMIFYRNAKGDILVKFLCNERESHIPSLSAVNEYYYKWTDVREHILRRIGNR